MNNTDPFSAIPNLGQIKEKVKEKTTVKVTTGEVQSGWGCVSVSTKLSYHHKPDPDNWNQNDLQWYLKNRYADKYGVMLNIPIAAGHNWIGTIKHAMYKRLGSEPKNGLVKDYFDFCLDRHADEIIRTEGSFSLYKLTKIKYIADYFDRRQPAASPQMPATAPVEPSASVEPLSIDDLTAAYRINSQYMVTNYGIVIPVNYLMVVKNKSLDEALAYVQSAIAKLAAKGAQEMGKVIDATNKFQPYPKWLRFVDVAKIVKMTISVSDDNPAFGALRSMV